MSQSDKFTQEFRDKCKRIWSVAYLRGRGLKVGETYPLPENQFLEFKGGLRSDAQWTLDNFNKYSFGLAPMILASFINGAFLNNGIPSDACRIVFGVHDKSRIVHGIQLTDNPLETDPSLCCKTLASDLTERLRRKLMECISHPAGYASSIINAVTIEVTHLASDSVSHIYVVVTVALDLAQFIIRPTVMSQSVGKTPSRYFVRTAVPESRKMREDEAVTIFGSLPLGFPL